MSGNDPTGPAIYVDFHRPKMPVSGAVKVLTPEWFEAGESCPQTSIDLVNAIRQLTAERDEARRDYQLACEELKRLRERSTDATQLGE